jgi:hypothetical protein
MDKAKLLEKIKNNDLRPKGRPGSQQAKEAIIQLQVLNTMTDLDKKVAHRARRELSSVVAEYHRANKVKRFLRKKHTRG